MNRFKTAFIINPGAGGKRKNNIRKAALKKISESFPDSPLRFTGTSEEAASNTRELLESGFECIAVAGGDGTFNSALQGFFADDTGTPVRKDAALAIIPIGTGGDFRKTMGIENDPLAALSLLSGTSTKPCDIGIVEYTDFEGKTKKKYFLNITSFGLSGLVDKYVQESSKKLGGMLTFFISTLKAFTKYQNADVEVIIDDRDIKKLKSVLVAVANGRFFGGGMEIAPMADISDGLLEIIILGDMHLMDFIKHGSRLYGGRLTEHPDLIHKSGRKVRISPMSKKETMYMDMDGDPLGTIPATLEVIPSAINIKI